MTTPARTEAKRARRMARKTARNQNQERAGIPAMVRRAERAIKAARKKIAARPITVHVRGGVAYCDSPAVRIIDHDNR